MAGSVRWLQISIAAGVLALALESSALGAPGVPEELFGFPLGQRYKLPRPPDVVGEFPVKKITGQMTFLGYGIHLYFEPRQTYEVFPFTVEDDDNDPKYYKTSFRVYAYPIIPSGVESLLDLQNIYPDLEWLVALIEWRGKQDSKDDAYYLVFDLCKTFQVSTEITPATNNLYNDKDYSCIFTENDRDLKIENIDDVVYFSISLTNEVTNRLDSEIDTLVRRLRAKDILSK